MNRDYARRMNRAVPSVSEGRGEEKTAKANTSAAQKRVRDNNWEKSTSVRENPLYTVMSTPKRGANACSKEGASETEQAARERV